MNLFSIHRQTSCSVRIIFIHHCLVWCIFYNPHLEHGMYDLTRRPGRGINTLHNGLGWVMKNKKSLASLDYFLFFITHPKPLYNIYIHHTRQWCMKIILTLQLVWRCMENKFTKILAYDWTRRPGRGIKHYTRHCCISYYVAFLSWVTWTIIRNAFRVNEVKIYCKWLKFYIKPDWLVMYM